MFSYRLALLTALFLLICSACSDSTVVGNPSDPEATILAPTDGLIAVLGSEISFLGQVADRGTASADLTIVWSSSLDGTLLDGSVDSEGRSEWNSTELSLGEHTITLVVVDPLGASASDSVAITVSEEQPENQVPSITIEEPGTTSVYSSDDAVPLSTTVSDPEDEAEALSVTWEVAESGDVLISNSVPNSSGVSSASASLPEGSWTLTATVTDSGGLTAQASVAVEITGAQSSPTAPGVDILPAAPQPSDDLSCFVDTPSTDADGDPLTYSFSWSVDGSPSGHSLSAALVSDILVVPSADTASGEVWSCEVVANDGSEDGPPGTASVVLGECSDLNGDCYADIVFSNSHFDDNSYSISSYIYWGGPSGPDPNFATLLPTQGAMANAIADLDGDGSLDIVFANERSDTTTLAVDSYIYWGGGANYGAGNRTGLPTIGARDVHVADLDDDGYPDLVFANAYDGNNYSIDSTIYWGSAMGFGLWAQTSLPTRGAEGIATSDLDGDGYLDIVFANMFNGASHSIDSYIYWGGPSGFDVSSRTELPTEGATDVAVSDLDGDGFIDIVFSNGIDDAVGYATDSYVYWGSAAGYTTANRTDLPTRGSWGVTLADLDNDGYSELLFSNRFEGGYYTIDSYIYWGSASGYSIFSRTGLATEGARASAVADLNGDGLLDIAFANVRSGTATLAIDSFVYWGTGNSASPFASSPAGFSTLGAAGVSIAD